MDEVYARLCAEGSPFETMRTTIAGRECTVYRHAPPTLRHVLEGSRAFGDRTCIVFEDERLDYASHYRAVAHLARHLGETHGIRAGEHVVFAMRNWPEWSVIFWAVTALGAVAVPLNAWSSAQELRALIGRSGARLVLLDGERHERLGHVAASALGADAILRVRGTGEADGVENLESLLGPVAGYRNLSEATLPEAVIEPDDPACILFTSGTTGRPHAAQATHRNILSNLMSRRFSAARAALRRGAEVPAPRPIVLLAPVPLFHVTGCYSYLVPTFANGDTMVLMHRWDPDRAVTLIEREGITAVGGVPTMPVQLLASRAFSPERLKSVAAITVGGGASGRALVERINAALPAVVTGNGYGMTETCSLITQVTAEDHRHRPDSVGTLVPVCEARLVDANGAEVGANANGELWIRGANVITEYWNEPEATAERFVDGWLRTGDVVRRDEEGFFYVVDRLRDLVIRGGENVSCVEVEDALLSHAGVIEAAVFGLPDDELGEIVAAQVHVADGFDGDAASLRRAVSARLAAFKVPAWIALSHEAMPRNAAGKVIKSRVREQALASRTGDRSG